VNDSTLIFLHQKDALLCPGTLDVHWDSQPWRMNIMTPLPYPNNLPWNFIGTTRQSIQLVSLIICCKKIIFLGEIKILLI
jgi:hypothetical protein